MNILLLDYHDSSINKISVPDDTPISDVEDILSKNFYLDDCFWTFTENFDIYNYIYDGKKLIFEGI